MVWWLRWRSRPSPSDSASKGPPRPQQLLSFTVAVSTRRARWMGWDASWAGRQAGWLGWVNLGDRATFFDSCILELSVGLCGRMEWNTRPIGHKAIRNLVGPGRPMLSLARSLARPPHSGDRQTWYAKNIDYGTHPNGPVVTGDYLRQCRGDLWVKLFIDITTNCHFLLSCRPA